MPSVLALDDELYCLDLNFQGQQEVIAAFLYRSQDDIGLIETGPTSTLPVLLDSLAALDVDPNAVTKILVTHIHLDHAGAAGTLMHHFPRARLYVHPIGAPHVADPSRLLGSATRIYGDKMDSLWGAVEAVPAARITTVDTGDVVTIGRRRLNVLYTPGHASHHVVFYDAARRLLFAGDAACLRIPEHATVRPATPPPDLDLEAWEQSLVAMNRLQAETLVLTHFGPFLDVERHLDAARRLLPSWAKLVASGLRAGLDREEIVARIRAQALAEVSHDTDNPQILERYELAGPTAMSVDGYLRYFRKHPEHLSSDA